MHRSPNPDTTAWNHNTDVTPDDLFDKTNDDTTDETSHLNQSDRAKIQLSNVQNAVIFI